MDHERRLVAHSAIALIVFLVALLPWMSARADEGGVAFWLSGQYASLSAVPGTPGWSLPIQAYYYDGDASQSKTFSRGDMLVGGLRSRFPIVYVQPTYSPK